MNRLAVLLTAAVLLVGSVSALPAAAAAASSALPASSTALQADATATNVTPGQRLAGVIGAGQAEFEGELALRAYGLEYAAATSDAAKAEVVRERLQAARDRLDSLERRKAALEAARANGSMGEGEYQARATALAARGQQVRALANASQARAERLPDEVLAEKGINTTEIRTLQREAADLTGPEVAAIARDIAGPGVGRSVSHGPPTGVDEPDARGGAPEDPANATNRTTDDPGQGNGGGGG